jgi:tetratricopeptide (TPR) repeat protein
MWDWLSRNWDAIKDALLLAFAFLGVLATAGYFNRRQRHIRELLYIEQERDDLRKKLVRAEMRLAEVDPERFIERVRDLRRDGAWSEVEAAAAARRCVAMVRIEHGERSSQFGAVLSVHAGCLEGLAANDEAEPLFREALEIKPAAAGEAHPDTANSLGNLAVLLAERGEVAHALPLEEQALAILEAALGAEHPKTLAKRRSLAKMHADAGK